MKSKQVKIPDEIIMNKIYLIRGHKVMIDRDLSDLYGVETRVLNQAVRRNLNRFPRDFMFRMNAKEIEDWMSQIVISNREKMGLRKPPLVFTEQGVTMLSCVLNSERAIAVNIHIIRIFAKMREMLLSHKDLLLKVVELEKEFEKHDDKIVLIFDYLKQFINLKKNRSSPIGFKQLNKKSNIKK